MHENATRLMKKLVCGCSKKKKTKNTNDTVVERKEKQREWLKGRILCKGRNEPSHHDPYSGYEEEHKKLLTNFKNNAGAFRTC